MYQDDICLFLITPLFKLVSLVLPAIFHYRDVMPIQSGSAPDFWSSLLGPKKVTLMFHLTTFCSDYGSHSLRHHFVTFMQCHLFSSRVAFIFHQAQWGWGLDSVVADPCVKMMSHAPWHNLSLMNCGIVILEYDHHQGGKKQLMEKPGHSAMYSADLILWAHNINEPWPDQLKQPQIITRPPQACRTEKVKAVLLLRHYQQTTIMLMPCLLLPTG